MRHHRALAEDLKKWMADEPVSAWSEPLVRRASRWARRHRPLVTSATVTTVLGLLAASYVFYEARLNASQRRTAAIGRVNALITAEIPALPGILSQLEPDRLVVRDMLDRIARGDGTGRDGRQRLPAALALLPVDPTPG